MLIDPKLQRLTSIVKTNCLVELMWDEAIARARQLDALPEAKGALFGLPISTKEHHGMVGPHVTSSASLVGWIGKEHGSNLLYDTLWDEGCVFYARTTQPQSIMHLETNSNVYGRTVNPYNRNLTSGGSSGGESALLGMRGSIVVSTPPIVYAELSLCSAGNWWRYWGQCQMSIRACRTLRIQVLCFGHHALSTWLTRSRPTNKRISATGQRSHMIGKEAIVSTPGPMTVDRESMELIMRVALAALPWRVDPSLTVKDWTPYKFTEPLKIAVQWWDGIVQPHPPMTRALKEVAEACRKAGMEIVDWDSVSLDHRKGWEILSSLYWPDGGEEVMGVIEQSGEPVLPLTKFIIEEQPSVKNMTQHELWQVWQSTNLQRSTN